MYTHAQWKHGHASTLSFSPFVTAEENILALCNSLSKSTCMCKHTVEAWGRSQARLISFPSCLVPSVAVTEKEACAYEHVEGRAAGWQ